MKSQQGTGRAYAKALFSLAKERNQIDTIAGELEAAIALVDGEPALAGFFARPWVGAQAKKNAAGEVATRLGFSKLTHDCLVLLAMRGRIDHLAAIAAAYRELDDAEQGRVRARVRTATPLTEQDRATLASRLGRALARARGGAPPSVVIDEAVDTSLLGGFVAEIGSVLVDGSLDGQLARVHDRLARA